MGCGKYWTAGGSQKCGLWANMGELKKYQEPSDTPSGFNLYYQEVQANTASTAFLRLMGS